MKSKGRKKFNRYVVSVGVWVEDYGNGSTKEVEFKIPEGNKFEITNLYVYKGRKGSEVLCKQITLNEKGKEFEINYEKRM